MFIAGWGLFGKVHKSRKGPFIATKCTHVFFFPFEPLDSYIVTHAEFPHFAGVRIPLYEPSVRAASLRALSIVGILPALPAWFISSAVWSVGRQLFTWWAIVFAALVVLAVACTFALIRSYRRDLWAPPQIEEMIDRMLAEHGRAASTAATAPRRDG